MTFKKWITAGNDKPFYARKEFILSGSVKQAAVKVCGLGQFHLWLNGQKVSDHELDPGWTDYNKLVQYVTFDVTDLLGAGRNCVGVEVGNGWFLKEDEHYTFRFPEFMPPNPNPYKPFGKQLILALELTVTYADGGVETVTADESFQVAPHPVVMSNVYGSETIDGGMVQRGWCTPGFAATDWSGASLAPAPSGKLVEQTQPPIRIIKSYPGKILRTINGRDVYDFGQNMSCVLEFEAKGGAGDTVRLYPAEKLDSLGDVDQTAKGWIAIDTRLTYIIGQSDVWENCRMKFTYLAGRFVAAELPKGCEIRNLTAHAITSAWKTDGSFTCDDERFNKIYDMVEKTVEANMVSVHTDCPTIERFAWQEPNHLMAPAIFYMKDGKALWEKFFADLRAAQHTAEDYFYDLAGEKYYPGAGLVPSQAPCYVPNVLPVPGMGSFYDIPPWGSTAILGVYWHYWFYGDKQVICDNFEMGKNYIRHLRGKLNSDGFLNHGLGDWGNPRNEYARENVETAFLYADAMVMARFAGTIHEPETESEMKELAERVRLNYNDKLLVRHPDGFWCYRAWDHPNDLTLTQAAQALPLFWGMVPEDRERDIAKALEYTVRRDGAFISGEVGLPYIIQCLRKYGLNDLISDCVLREEHPSYYAFVLDNETTLGEYWEHNPRSHCHDMMGHIIEWYYNGLAGIIPEKPGFAKITVRPYLPESVSELTCSYHAVSGEIGVRIKDTGDAIRLAVTIPDGVEATVDAGLLRERNPVVARVNGRSFGKNVKII